MSLPIRNNFSPVREKRSLSDAPTPSPKRRKRNSDEGPALRPTSLPNTPTKLEKGRVRKNSTARRRLFNLTPSENKKPTADNNPITFDVLKERIKKNKPIDITMIKTANLTLREKISLLHAACSSGHLEALLNLLNLKIDVNIKFEQNLTPLYVAVECGHVKIVEALLKAKASPAIQDSDGYTPLDIAVSNGHTTIVRTLCKVAKIDAQNAGNRTPLHVAAIFGQVESARILLENKANIEAWYGDEKRTPLHLACQNGYIKFVKFLLEEKEAKIEAKDEFGYTALHIAAEENQDEIVTLLTNLGADREARTESGKTALHIATEKGQTEAVLALVRSKSVIGALDFQGKKPIHYAVLEKRVETLKALIKLGADINATDAFSITSLHMASFNNDPEIANALLKLGANPNAQDSQKQTPLHIACKEGHNKIATLLLNKGASTTLRDCFHLTPIHYAAKIGDGTLAKSLIKESGERVFCLALWPPREVFKMITNNSSDQTLLEQQESGLMAQKVLLVDEIDYKETTFANPYQFLQLIENNYFPEPSDPFEAVASEHIPLPYSSFELVEVSIDSEPSLEIPTEDRYPQVPTYSFEEGYDPDSASISEPGLTFDDSFGSTIGANSQLPSNINEMMPPIPSLQMVPSVIDFLTDENTINVLSDAFSQLPSSVMARLTHSKPNTIKKCFKAIPEFHLPAVVPFLQKEHLSFLMERLPSPMCISILAMALPQDQKLLFGEEVKNLEQEKYKNLFFTEEALTNFFAARQGESKLPKTALKHQLKQLKSMLRAKGHFIDKISKILGKKEAQQLLSLWTQKFAAMAKDIDNLPDESKKEEPPEEFLDCITSEVMDSPQKVRGPPVWIADRATVERLEKNPYTREPLTSKNFTRLPKLKARIEEWKKAKKGS